MKKTHDIGLCLKIFKILELKVGASSMAMEENGGKTHAKSTKHKYGIGLNSSISFSSTFFLLIEDELIIYNNYLSLPFFCSLARMHQL
jgi:hypothetical protein